MKTKIVNDTSVDIIVKERNESVTRKLSDLKPGKHFPLDVDPNAAYREYHISFPGQADRNPVIFSTDDLNQYSTIAIRLKESKPNETDPQKLGYTWEGGAKRDTAAGPLQHLANLFKGPGGNSGDQPDQQPVQRPLQGSKRSDPASYV